MVHVCRSAVQRILDQQDGSHGACPDERLLILPEPDRRPECKASIGLGHSNALWSTVTVKLMQLRLVGQPPLAPTSVRWAEVGLHAMLVMTKQLLPAAY